LTRAATLPIVGGMVERKDVEAALQARHELGREYEPEIVEAMVDRIEKRLDERLRERRQPAPRHHYYELRLALGSMGIGIGVTAVANSNAHGVGGVIISIIAWIAIAAINIAYARRG
jgi:hypothetical protein